MADTTAAWRAAVLALAGDAWQLEDTGYAVPWERPDPPSTDAPRPPCLIDDCPVCAGEEPPADAE